MKLKLLILTIFWLISVAGFSQATQGTRVTAPIVPNDSSDVYPTHDETFGRGGYRTVSSIAQRDAIKQAYRKEGMLVKVIQDNKTYTLKGGIDNANWQIFLNIDSINNLKVTQKLLVQALPGAYATTFPFQVIDSAGYTRGAISGKGLLITGRQHNPTVNVDALALIGAKNQVSGVDGIAIGTNSQSISDSSISVGKNLINTRVGSVQVGYSSNYLSFASDSARAYGNWPFLKKSYTPTWGTITGTLSNQTDLQNALNAKQNSLGTGTTAQFLRGDLTWQSIPASSWGTITGTLSNQTDLQNALNAKQNSLGTGTTAQFLRGDLTWQSVPASATWGGITGTLSNQTDLVTEFSKYFKKYGGQVRQDTLTQSGIYEGINAINAPWPATEDNVVFSANAGAGWGAMQLAYGIHQNKLWYRGSEYNYNYKPWKQIATTDTLASYSLTTHTHTQYATTTALSAATGTYDYVFNNTNADVTVYSYQLRKFGNVVSLTISFSKTTADANNTSVKIGDIPLASRPTTSTIYGAMSTIAGHAIETGTMYITTGGDVYVNVGIAGQTWFANLTWIQFNP